MKDLLIKYKQDFSFITVLSIIFLLIFLLNFKGLIISLFDVGREFYVPSLILQGKVLYKDVFMMYPPMGYQFNAFLYAIFGQSFKVLMISSLLTAYFVLLSVYFILRQFLKPFYCFSVAMIVLNFCIFYQNGLMKYVFPYSYGMIYATCAFLYFCLFSIIYFKNNMQNDKISYLASFLLGISLVNKFEFAVCVVPFLIFLMKKRSLKTLFLNILSFCIPAVFSWGILILQGLSLSEIINFHIFQLTVLKTKQMKYYMRLQADDVILNILFFIGYILYSIVSVFLLNKIFEQNNRRKVLYFSLYLIVSTYICLLCRIFFFRCPFLLFCIFLFFICGYKLFKKQYDLIFFFLSACAVLISARISFLYNVEHYYFLGILAIILNFLFIFNLKIKENIKNAICIFLLIVSCQIVLNKYIFRNFKTTEVKTQKGSFYMIPKSGEVYKKLILWIEENTDEKDKILMLPEAPLINFITNRPTDNRYFQLLPNHIEAIGEEKIVDDLKHELPQYIAVQKIDYDVYGQKTFGQDFGLALIKFIIEQYEIVEGFSEKDFNVLIFKKKCLDKMSTD